jgi:hypothetical protein
LSSSYEILPSACYNLMEWPSTVFFIWMKRFLFPGFLFDSFFWGFPDLWSTSLSYLVLSSLFHVSLFCSFFLFHFGVCWSPLWVHLVIFCVFSSFFCLFVLSWYSLSSLCTFYLTIFVASHEHLNEFIHDFLFETYFVDSLSLFVKFMIILLG